MSPFEYEDFKTYDADGNFVILIPTGLVDIETVEGAEYMELRIDQVAKAYDLDYGYADFQDHTYPGYVAVPIMKHCEDNLCNAFRDDWVDSPVSTIMFPKYYEEHMI